MGAKIGKKQARLGMFGVKDESLGLGVKRLQV